MTRRKPTAKGPKRGPNCQHPSCGLSQCRDGGFGGEPSGTRTRDPLIKSEGRFITGPPSFCAVPRNRAPLLEFSLLALGTVRDSRCTRGLKSAFLTGAFSANQRKLANP